MKDITQTQDSRSSSEIQEDIQGARDDMDQTLDSLNDRLSPRALINGLMDWFENRDSSSTESLARKPKQFARFVRDNPVPALLTGIGVAWLIAESQSEDDDEPDFHRYQVDDEGPGVTAKLKDKLGDASDAVSSASSAARDKLSSAGDKIAEQGSRAKSAIKSGAARGRQSAGQASDLVQRGYAKAGVRVKEAVDDYPLGFGAGFLGLGLLAGLLLPRSEAEDGWFGESADEIKDAVTDKGEELLERGKEVAGRVVDEAAHEAERQGLTVDKASHALESLGDKVGSVVEAGKAEGKKAAPAAAS